MQLGYRIFWGLLIIACILTYLSLIISSGTFLLSHNPRYMDFLAFYTGSKLLSISPSELYNLHRQFILQRNIDPLISSQNHFIAYLNPPFAALFFIPFLNLGLQNTYAVWVSINVSFLVALCFIAYQQLKPMKWYFIVPIILGIATFIPVLTTLLLGQFSILLCLIVLLLWINLKKDREFLSGFLLSMLLIKPQFLILPILAFTAQRRIKVLTGLLAGIIFLLVISSILVGWDGINNYLASLNAAYIGNVNYDVDLMAQHSLQTMLLIVFKTQSIATIQIPWFFTSGLITLVTIFIWFKKRNYSTPQFSYQFALLFIATLITSPHTHFHDLSLLIIIAVILFSTMKKSIPKVKLYIMVLLSLSYAIIFIGFLFDVFTQMHSRAIWIVTDVSYLVVFWFLVCNMFFTFP